MKSNYFQTHTTILAIITAMTLLFVGCSNPASNDDDNHEEHSEAVGAVLKMNGAEIVRIEEGVVQSGQIEVNEGEETPLISIHFLAEDGDEFQPDEPEYLLRWDQIDETIAKVEQHESDGKWSFHVAGISQGNTSVVFRLWHEGEGHADYYTPEIAVVVN